MDALSLLAKAYGRGAQHGRYIVATDHHDRRSRRLRVARPEGRKDHKRARCKRAHKRSVANRSQTGAPPAESIVWRLSGENVKSLSIFCAGTRSGTFPEP
jgi:hypothetical protein